MTKKRRALARSMENWRDIITGTREGLIRDKIKAEEAFMATLEKGKETKSHIGDFNTPDYASQRKIEDLDKRIQKYSAAIRRIDQGTYGKCAKMDDCEGNGEVEPELLAKDPTRRHCRECQEAVDKDMEKANKIRNYRGGIRGRWTSPSTHRNTFR